MLKQIRLRDKMTLWYTLLVFLTTAAFSASVYFLVGYVLEEVLESEVRLSLKQVAAQVENEDETLSYENEVPVSGNTMYFITEENGSELYAHGADITLLDDVPMEPGVFRSITRAGQRWLLLDSDVLTVDHFRVQIRVAASCATNDRVLSMLRLMLLVVLPVLIVAAWLGGRLIAGRALAPIRRIINSADSIAEGDLSARIPEAPSKDELGELTDTLNQMLDSVETAFTREKRFASDASHELRTPVAILRAYTETLLTDSSVTEEQRAALGTILHECERMQKIIGQLLTITRGQEGRYPICLEHISPLTVCDGVEEALADRIAQKRIALTRDIPSELMLYADQSLFTELLMNLVENAIKYNLDGGRIDIRAAREDNHIMLTVADNGIGIPAEALPHIFDRFFRVDAARDRSGTGLGLSICDWIVKAHGGTICAESRLGQGTTMRVVLPIENAGIA